MGKRIVIIGAGAVGGYTGAHMARAGEDVTFIDPWPEHVEEIKRNGLRITHHQGGEPFTSRPRALHLTEAQQLAKEAPVDIVKQVERGELKQDPRHITELRLN